MEVLECFLSRDTGLTGKEGWKSVFVSHQLHNKPTAFFFFLLLSIFFFPPELPVWLGPPRADSTSCVFYWLVWKGEGGPQR